MPLMLPQPLTSGMNRDQAEAALRECQPERPREEPISQAHAAIGLQPKEQFLARELVSSGRQSLRGLFQGGRHMPCAENADILHYAQAVFCIAGDRPECDFRRMDATTHKTQVGYRLRMAIDAIGKRPVDVARDFNVSSSKLGNWMRGENYPDVWFICQFCERYNITTDWIYLERVSAIPGVVADALWAAVKASEEAGEGPDYRVPAHKKKKDGLRQMSRGNEDKAKSKP